MTEASGKMLDKASRAIRAAERLLASGDAEFAVGRVYYAMFYVAGALLLQKALRFHRHGAVHGAFALKFC